MSFEQELATFMAITRRHESGRFEGRYTVYGPPVGRSGNRARGAYQILAPYWAQWAAAAGIPGANWRDPRAQDKVAAYQFTRYYNAFGGNWDLVSTAWYSGGSRAKRVYEKYGANATVEQIRRELGNQIADYVARNHRFHDELFNSSYATQNALEPLAWGGQTTTSVQERAASDPLHVEHPNPTFSQAGSQASKILRSNLEAMANHTAGGRRMSIEDVQAQQVEPVEATRPVTNVQAMPADTEGGEDEQRADQGDTASAAGRRVRPRAD